MSRLEYDDNCAGCRPVILSLDGKEIREPYVLAAIDLVWSLTTLAERRAWHRFTCLNSRAAGDVEAARSITAGIQRAMEPRQ